MSPLSHETWPFNFTLSNIPFSLKILVIQLCFVEYKKCVTRVQILWYHYGFFLFSCISAGQNTALRYYYVCKGTYFMIVCDRFKEIHVHSRRAGEEENLVISMRKFKCLFHPNMTSIKIPNSSHAFFN